MIRQARARQELCFLLQGCQQELDLTFPQERELVFQQGLESQRGSGLAYRPGLVPLLGLALRLASAREFRLVLVPGWCLRAGSREQPEFRFREESRELAGSRQIRLGHQPWWLRRKHSPSPSWPSL